MSEVLNLQQEDPDTPGEEKGSWVSVLACRKSYASIAFCVAK